MNYIKTTSMIFAILMAFFILPNIATAHNGTRDELGGHFRNADCVYLLHEPTSLAKSAQNISELINLIQQYNSNTDCNTGLNEERIDLEGYSFSGEESEPSQPEQDSSNLPIAAASPGKLQIGKTYQAELSDCTDGDTAVFTINGKDYKTRFLYIDTPESTRTKEAFGPEAAQYTCNFLKQGKIKLETDGGSLFDKYERLLAWVWVEDKLHQEEITKAGLVEDFYDYGNYKYENRIWSAMDYAKENGTGMYADSDSAAESKEDPAKNKDKSPGQQQAQNNEGEEHQKNKQPENEGDDTKSDKQQESKQESSKAEPLNEEFGCSFLNGLVFAFLFYLIGPLKKAMGKRTLIVHRLWSKKWPLNVLLVIIYAVLCYITMLLLLLEVLYIFKNKKRKES